MQSVISGSTIPAWKNNFNSQPTSSSSHHSHSHGHSHSKDKSNKRKATRVQRACSNCRKRKQGCEEERPCRRCVEKGIDCTEVEPKRKRGRSKSFGDGAGRERHHTRSGSHGDIYSDEDDSEGSFESESEEFSSEDGDESTTISPRGAASNKSANKSTNGLNSHSFQLTGSNTSTGSVHQSPFVSSHSITLSNTNSHVPLSSSYSNSLSNSNSNVHVHSNSNSNVHSLSNSNSSVPTLNFRELRLRSNSSSSPPDSPSAADVNDDAENENEYLDYPMLDQFSMEVNATRGLSLSLLIPFIGNLSPNEEQTTTPMFVDDEYGYLLENDVSSFAPSGGSLQSKPQISVSANTDAMSLHNKIWNNDLPFFTSAVESLPKGVTIEDGDCRAQAYIKECWDEFQTKSKNHNVDSDLQRVNELWKEILQCLRRLDWQNLHNLLEEVEGSSTCQRLGDHTKPSVVFWSSGGRIHHANDSFCKLVGYSASELHADVSDVHRTLPSQLGSTLRAHSFFHPEEMMKIMKRQLEAVQHPEKSSFQMNTRLLSKQRQEIPVSCSILNLRDTLGMSLLTVAIFV